MVTLILASVLGFLDPSPTYRETHVLPVGTILQDSRYLYGDYHVIEKYIPKGARTIDGVRYSEDGYYVTTHYSCAGLYSIPTVDHISEKDIHPKSYLKISYYP